MAEKTQHEAPHEAPTASAVLTIVLVPGTLEWVPHSFWACLWSKIRVIFLRRA